MLWKLKSDPLVVSWGCCWISYHVFPIHMQAYSLSEWGRRYCAVITKSRWCLISAMQISITVSLHIPSFLTVISIFNVCNIEILKIPIRKDLSIFSFPLGGESCEKKNAKQFSFFFFFSLAHLILIEINSVEIPFISWNFFSSCWIHFHHHFSLLSYLHVISKRDFFTHKTSTSLSTSSACVFQVSSSEYFSVCFETENGSKDKDEIFIAATKKIALG